MFDIRQITFELELATLYAEDLYAEYSQSLGLRTPWELLSKEDKAVWYSLGRKAVKEAPYLS